MIKVVGHRGAAGEEPENTLRSILRGIECGADFVEVDVRSTRDGVLVLLHDETLDRTTSGSGPLREWDFDEVRRLDAGKGERIPTVEEALEVVRGRCGILLELKEVGWEGRLFRVVEGAGMLSDAIFISFHRECVEALRDLGGAVGVIFADRPYEHLEYARRADVDLVAPHYRLVDSEFVSRASEYGLKVNAWTVNDVSVMVRLIRLGVFAITSDYPCLLRRVVDERGTGEGRP